MSHMDDRRSMRDEGGGAPARTPIDTITLEKTCKRIGCHRPRSIGSRYCYRCPEIPDPCRPFDDPDTTHDLREILERDSEPPSQTSTAPDLVETPIDAKDLCLNPGADEAAPENPLCPVCEDPIRPVTGEHTRRFECGCEIVWQFRFEAEDDDQ